MSTTITIDGHEYSRDELRGKIKDSYPRLYPQDIDLYIEECIRRGVHPLSRLIVPRPNIRKDKDGSYVRGGPPAWIVTIDLMRAKADQTGTYVPGDEAQFVYNGNKELVTAKASVRKLVGNQVVMFTESADWDEYYPGEGNEGAMWRKMPRVMLSKVAEARALRKGWPAQLQGLYESGEMDQAGPTEPITPTPTHTTPDAPAPLTDSQFVAEIITAAEARGATVDQAKAWLESSLEKNNLTLAGINDTQRRALIARMRDGKYDADLLPPKPAADDGWQATVDEFRLNAHELAALTLEDADAALQKWLRRVGFSKNPASLPPARRQELLKSQHDGRFNYETGAIAAAIPATANA